MNIATNFTRRLPLFVAFLAVFGIISAANGQSLRVEPASGFLEFNAHAGGQATQTVYLQNLTSTPLVVMASISGNDSARFSMNSLSVITLLDTLRQALTVTYRPTLAGSDSAVLTFMTATDTQRVNLYGNAVASGSDHITVASEVNFSARAGESQCIPIAIGNMTLGAVTLSNIHITGGNNQFMMSSADSGALAVGGLDTVTICYTPVAGSEDAHATLTFDYAGLLDTLMSGVRTVELNGHVLDSARASDSLFFHVTEGLEFEDVTVGTQVCKTVRISNPTASTVVIDSASVTGSGASYYTVSGASNLVVTAGTTQYVNVCFMPTVSSDSLNGTLNLFYTTSDSTHGTLYVSLEGSTEDMDTTGHGTGSNRCIHVRHAIGVIGPIVQGGRDSSTIYLTNATGGSVMITGATVSSGDSAAFSVASTQFPLTIAAGQQGQFNVSFYPTNAGAHNQVRYTSLITLQATGDSLNCGPVTIQVGGVAVPGNHRDTSKHPLSGHFTVGGSVDLTNTIGITTNTGATMVDTLTFTNTSSTPILVNSIFMQTTPNLSLLGTSVTAPTTIQPGGTVQAFVQFNPNGQIGSVFSNSLYIATDQSIMPQAYNIQAVQTAAAAVAAVTPQSIDFSIVPNPSSGEFRVVVPSAPSLLHVDIFDVLGNHVAQVSADQNYSWNGVDKTGSTVPAGVYVVRVSGTDVNGHEFRGTKQVAVQK